MILMGSTKDRKAVEAFIYILYVYMYSSNCTKYGSKHNKQI